MVKVIPRVRLLIDVLTERGFVAIAADILRGLDQGVLLSADEGEVLTKQIDSQSPTPLEIEQIWYPQTSEEQANFVANIVVDQLIMPLRMRLRSAELLSAMMGSEVQIMNVSSDGDVFPFHSDAVANLIVGNEGLAEDLRAWLASDDDEQVT